MVHHYANEETSKAVLFEDMEELNPEMARLIECAMMVKYSYRDSLCETRDKFAYYIESLDNDMEYEKKMMFLKQKSQV